MTGEEGRHDLDAQSMCYIENYPEIGQCTLTYSISFGLKVLPEQEDANHLQLEGSDLGELRLHLRTLKVFPPVHSFLTWPIIHAQSESILLSHLWPLYQNK